MLWGRCVPSFVQAPTVERPIFCIRSGAETSLAVGETNSSTRAECVRYDAESTILAHENTSSSSPFRPPSVRLGRRPRDL